MSKVYCERCASTGIVKASLIKNEETFKNEHIAVVLCDEYSEDTEANLALLALGGLEVRIVGKASETPPMGGEQS